MTDTSRIHDAILLVAGVGSRLRPLTDELPKCLLEVGGEPLLIRLLRQLHSHGIDHAVLATGYLEPKIRACVAGYSGLPQVTIRDNPQFSETNNAESLRQAMPAVDGRPFILCDGDILVRESGWLGDLLDNERGNVLAMISPDEMGEEEMKIALADTDGDVPVEDCEVVGLSKELDPKESAGESLGVQTISQNFFEPLSERLDAMSPSEKASSYYEDIFADLMGDEHVFYAHPVPADCWTEIDTVEDLEYARELFADWQDAGGQDAGEQD
jgi:choline kinase